MNTLRLPAVPPYEERPGRVLSQQEYVLSVLVSTQMGAIWGHCYENAYSIFFALPDLFAPSGTFVEGWIVFEDSAHRVVLLEHGWIVSKNDHMVDPTIVLGVGPDQTLLYFPGVVRSWQETDALNNELFPHVRFSDYGEDGMGHPQYRAAYAAARRQAQALLSPTKQFIDVRASYGSADETKQAMSAELTALLVVVSPHETGEGRETR